MIVSIVAGLIGLGVAVVLAKVSAANQKPVIKTTGAIIEENTASTAPADLTFEATKAPTPTSVTTIQLAHVDGKTTWQQEGVTVAGGHGQGFLLDQLQYPRGMDVDDNMTVYVADSSNDRVVRWRAGAKNGELIDIHFNPLTPMPYSSGPMDVAIDRRHSALLVCDLSGRRLIRVFHHEPSKEAIVLVSTSCYRIVIDRNGDVYMTDTRRQSISRWKEGESQDTVIAGGNAEGDGPHQLNNPEQLAVDAEQTVYVADSLNNRVLKWRKNATVGEIVAGGKDATDGRTKIRSPMGLTLDHAGNVYVLTKSDPRIIRFSNNSPVGTVVINGHAFGHLSSPQGLAFDRVGNLYFVDKFKQHVQKFPICP